MEWIIIVSGLLTILFGLKNISYSNKAIKSLDRMIERDKALLKTMKNFVFTTLKYWSTAAT